MFILYDIWWYGWLWLGFVAVAFCTTRFMGGFGCLLSGFVIAGILLVLDVNWIYDDMRHHPENGRDADFIFMFGVLIRVVVFNLLLLPVSFLGAWLRRRSRTAKLAHTTA